ncbi:MASE1 domain-containing protein [Stenotrophomonas sp. AB1(2024)]|uniref:MASE1 domain-containing protein n=1 Tax=Stenotrophomonas sp. AB1(2024) TaxID=3132215 RepID=UPI0030AA4DF7
MLVRGWRNALGFQFCIRIDGLLLALLYAVACWAARKISLDQLYLPAGIRVAALLVFPPRLWPYLVLGEYAYFAQLRLPLIEQHGLQWVILSSCYQIPAVALLVHFHRQAMKASTTTWILSVAALASAVTGMTNVWLMHLLWPTPPTSDIHSTAGLYILGHYVAILSIAPVALLWVQRYSAPSWEAWRHPTTIAALSLLVLLGVAAANLPATSPSTKTSLHLLMAAPVIALTCIHGWRGAAIGVPVLNLIIHFTTPVTGLPESFDAETFRTQQIMAVAGTALLALGSQITHYYHQFVARDLHGREANEYARNVQLAGEMDLRERALTLRSIGDGFDASLSTTAAWLEEQGHKQVASGLLHVSVVHSRKFREQTSMVYPTSLEHVGLYLALQLGGVGDTWEHTERMAQPHLNGDPCCLSLGLQLAAYRGLTEAVSLLLNHEAGQIQIRARCGRLQQMQGILIVVTVLDPAHRLSETTVRLAIERLRGRALPYGGTVQCRRNRIRLFLAEAPPL